MHFVYRLLALYGSAIILMFFSEFLFVNEGMVAILIGKLQINLALAIGELFILSTYYALFTFPFLALLSHYKVNTLLGLFLAGAIFGWAAEALVVPAVYEGVPYSFVWTSISWHPLIDVLVGWYFVRLVMRNKNVLWNLTMFIALGGFWAIWSTWYWTGESGGSFEIITPSEFSIFAYATGIFWIVGMVIADSFGRGGFYPTKWEVSFVALVAVVAFSITALPFLPISLSLLPFIALTVFALYKGRDVTGELTIDANLDEARPEWWKYVLALLTPLTATLIYPWLFEMQLRIPTEDIILVVMLIAVATFVRAIVKPFRLKKRP